MKIRKTLLLPLCCVFVMPLLAGCGGKGGAATASPPAGGGSSASLPPLTVTIFDKNTGAAFDDPVAREVMKRANVKVEIQQPSADPTEKLSLMLVSGDYPDVLLMDRGSDLVSKYIEAGAVIPLNDLIDQYGPNVASMYGDILNKSRYKDGKNYYLNNWYGLDPDPVWGILMRMDYLTQLVGAERAHSGEPFSTAEFKDLLGQYAEKYPGNIPMTLNGNAIKGHTLGVFTGMWGVEQYYVQGDALSYKQRDPRYFQALSYMNELSRAGLIDREWPVSKDDLWKQNLASDKVFATTGAYWDPGDPNKALLDAHNGDVEAQFYAFLVLPDGMTRQTVKIGGRSTLGWDAICITKNCAEPERVMQFFDFLASEEGQYLLMWGLEGKDWNMTDGKHTPEQSVIDGFINDWNQQRDTSGIRRWTWFVKNGVGKDGTPYDINKYIQSEVTLFARESLDKTFFDESVYSNLEPEGGTMESMNYQQIDDIITLALPKIIGASSPEECRSLYDKMIADMDAAGAAAVEAVFTQKYRERLTLWG